MLACLLARLRKDLIIKRFQLKLVNLEFCYQMCSVRKKNMLYFKRGCVRVG